MKKYFVINSIKRFRIYLGIFQLLLLLLLLFFYSSVDFINQLSNSHIGWMLWEKAKLLIIKDFMSVKVVNTSIKYKPFKNV